MHVAAHRKGHNPDTVRNHHKAYLVVEINEPLQNAGHGKQRQGFCDIGLRTQHCLSVTVITQSPRFQHTGIVHLDQRLK